MAVTTTFKELYQTVCTSRIQSMKRRLEKGQRLEEPCTPCYMTFSCLILSPDYCKSLLYQAYSKHSIPNTAGFVSMNVSPDTFSDSVTRWSRAWFSGYS